MNSNKKKIINDIVKKISTLLNGKKTNLHDPYFSKYEIPFLKKCIDTGYVSTAGPMVSKFENKIKKFTKSKHAISIVNGTESVKIALICSGVKKDMEVFVPSLTFVGSVSPIVDIGAIPHFVDSDEDDFGVDINKFKKYLEDNTIFKNNKTFNKKTGKVIKAIIPVHVFGHPCRIDEIIKICKKKNIIVIEDSTESLGSFYKNKHLGTFGLTGCLSFNGNKIITSGAGGMIITNNTKIAKRARHLSTTAKVQHEYEYIHNDFGFNLRMTNISAALGLAQFKNLKKFIKIKRRIFLMYHNGFKYMKNVKIFKENKFSKSNYWLQTMILDNNIKSIKNELIEKLISKGIKVRPAWKLISTLKPYKKFPSMDLEGAKNIYSKIVNLPSGVNILLK